MIRVVADTNIYISALMFGGLPGTLVDLGLSQLVHLVASPALLDELDEKLRLKFRVAAGDAAAIRRHLERAIDLVAPNLTIAAVPDDPDDNRILECAVAGRADVIVSGDRHLLRPGSYEGIPILTARQFLEMAGLA